MMLRLSPDAQLDISDIWAFTEERWGEDQAVRYVTRIRDALTELAAGRRSSRAADDILPGYRTCIIGSHTAYFRMDADDLIVIRILHQSMDPVTQFRP